MRKITKLLVLLLCMTAAMVCYGTAMAETRGTIGDHLNWVLDDNGLLTITGTGPMNTDWDDSSGPWGTEPTNIVIGTGVTSIGNNAFHDCDNLTSITIPNSITSIGNDAFTNCSNLTSITIPNSVTSIGSSAFGGCSSLTSITIPEGVTSIGNHAFISCSGLTSITIQEGVISIGEGAFKGCNSLTSITIPDSVISIGGGAFWDCKSLTSITISNSVTSIEYSTFMDCDSLTSITIPEGVTSIGNSAFYGCGSLMSITIPESVTSIGNYAFYGCSGLTSITIQEGVTSIGNNAFNGCSGLTSITIPESVTSIGNYAFNGCSSLTSITIQEGVTIIIWNNAFSGCSSLTSITIPEGVTIIGDSAFKGCSSLMSITIPEGVTSIGNSTFSDCSNLTSITIPESVTSIGNNAFSGCSNLTNITIPEGVTSIGNNAFNGCSGLTSITIPESVTSIGNYAFYGCSGLTSITIPEGVTIIGDSAFKGCSNLTSITIPEGATIIIGNYAFEKCSSLTSITIPEGVTSIGNYAFWNCWGLTSITIPDSVTSIGECAFVNCSSLMSITIPEGVTSIRNSAFSGCSSLTSITIPEGVTSIGEHAFYGCGSLTSITIPEGVTNIGNKAFQGCGSLTSITIPKGVTSIGNYAFNDCRSLQKVYFAETDGNVNIYFGSEPFDNRKSTVYCYIYTSPDSYFSAQGYLVQYIDELDIDTIRTITLPSDFSMACGDTLTLYYNVFPADGAEIIWTSSDSDVLVIDHGTVTAIAPGDAVVTATVGNVSQNINIETYTPATTITLNEAEVWVQAKQNISISVVAFTPENASGVITWSSSDTALATVNQEGLVSTFKPGDVTVTAMTEKGVTASCLIHLCYPVTAVTILPSSAEIKMNQTIQLETTVTTREGTYSNKLVSFKSSDETIAAVDANGIVTGMSPGVATITSSSYSGKTASCEITVLCSGHVAITDETLSPTCTETGLTEGSHCVVCGEVLVAQEVVPALGHDWGAPTYTWADDNSTVTATRVCANNAEHVETETVSTTTEVSLQPTCTGMGETTYTSSAFENAAFTVQSKTLTNVDAIGHNWGAPTYTWADDNSTVTATRICANDAEHIETETVEVTAVVTLQPTCTEMGETTYTSAAFENAAFTVQSKTLTDVDAIGHDWGAPTYTWADDNSTVTATHVCTNNAEHVETETVSVTTEVTLQPTCTGMGETTYTSDVFENAAFTVQSKTLTNVEAIGHNWGAPTYTWADDNSTVTATRVCVNDAEHAETETVTARRVVTISPDQTTEGEFKYISASFENEAFEGQEKAGGAIPPLSTLLVPVFPANLTAIEDEAFENTSFQVVIIPDTVTTIGNRAFANCRDLVYVYIPASVTSVPEDAFANCPNVIIDCISD